MGLFLPNNCQRIVDCLRTDLVVREGGESHSFLIMVLRDGDLELQNNVTKDEER